MNKKELKSKAFLEFQEKMMKLKTKGPRVLPKPSRIIKSKKTYSRKNVTDKNE